MLMKYGWATLAVCIFIFCSEHSTHGQTNSLPGDQGIANEITGSRADDNSFPADQTDAQRQTQNRRTVIQRLTQEMRDLIPVDYSDAEKIQSLNSISELFISGNVAAVTKRLESLASKDQEFPPVDLIKAGLHYAVNDLQGGGKLLEKLAIEQPDNPAVFMAFSRLAFSQNRISDALALCEKAQSKLSVARLSENSKKFFQTQIADSMTSIAEKQDRMDDAEMHAERWQALAPSSTRMLLARAELKFLRGDVPSAMKYLQQLRQVEPKSRPPEIVLASWFQQKGDAASVEKWIKDALGKYPDSAIVNLEYANWALSSEDFKTSLAAIAKYESLEGANASSQLLRARIAFAQQQYLDATGLLDELFKTRPNSFEVSNLYVLSLIENDDSAKQNLAYQLAQRNLRALPSNPVAAAAYGWVLLNRGATEDASKLLARTAKSTELPPELTFFVASMLEKNNQNGQAQTLLEPALKTKGLFLYRQRAQELYQRLSSSELPAPANK